MTDRELLELAAKAAGMSLTWGEKYKLGDDIIDCTDIPYAKSNQPDEADMYWNPLTDDGDALRLAVKLGMSIVVKTFPHGVYVDVYNGQAQSAIEPLADVRFKVANEAAATRRAIVRAAAEIGRSQT
jgi:hypothetical protein